MPDENDKPPIEVRNLTKRFGDHTVLNRISFGVSRGEVLAVLGRSGSGKSVLLKLIIHLLSPDSGGVCILGRDVGKVEDKELAEVRKKIGFLFQNAALYDSLTVADNVAFPLRRHTRLSPDERRRKSRELLASVGLKEDFEKMPSEISGGMQKRVGLARALALDPEIILFDEPTAGLDPITSAEIGQLISDLKGKRRMTAVVVTHDMHSARLFSDRVILLHEGAIAAEGTFPDLEKSSNSFVARFMEAASGNTHV